VRSDIPLMAVSTGDVDTLHCVLRKAGIADGEFTNPIGAGRVQLYRDTGAVIMRSEKSLLSMLATSKPRSPPLPMAA